MANVMPQKGVVMSTDAEVKTNKPSKTWMLSCGLLCLGILIYGFIGEREASGNLGFLVGYNLPIAIFIGGLLHLAFRHRETQSTGWLGAGLIFVSLLISSLLSASQAQHNMQVGAGEVERSLTEATATSNSPSATPIAVSSAPVASGEAGKLEAALKSMINRSVAQRQEYERELDAIGWSKILDAERIRKDTGLTESKALIRQARDIVSKYRGRTDELFSQVRRDIETSGLKPESLRDALAGFDSTSAQGKARSSELWSLEEQTLSQVENIFTLLATKRESWQVQKSQILFNNQGDLDLFNSYLTRIGEITAQQQALQNAGARRTQDGLKRLAQ